MEYHGNLQIVKQMYQQTNNPRYSKILDLDLCDEAKLDIVGYIVGSPYSQQVPK